MARFLKGLLFSFGAFSFGFSSLGQGTFGEMFEQARSAFIEGDYSSAFSGFSAIEDEFGAETEFHDPTFQKFFLSMFGMSAMMVQENQMAVELLEVYKSIHFKKEPSEAIILLGLLQSYKRLSRADELFALYDEFLNGYPNHQDYELLAFEKMQLYFHLGRIDEGIEEMEKISNIIRSQDLRNRAKLSGIQALSEVGRERDAGLLLTGTNWDVSGMPELAVLAFSAIRAGDYFLSQREYDRAIQCFQLVPFHRALIETQTQKLEVLERALARPQSNQRHSGSAWERHYFQVRKQIIERLNTISDAPDYTPAFLLKYGRCFLFAERFPEAWVVFRSLALQDEIDGEIKEQAWYHWVLSAYEANNWAEAIGLITEFRASFPSSALIPNVMFLLARSYQDSGDLDRGILVLTELLNGFPDHEDRGQWLLSRGFAQSMMEEYDAAIMDFDRVVEEGRSVETIMVRAQFWKSIALSSQDFFEEALAILEALKKEYPDHWMYPNFVYRFGMVQYSDRDYEAAESTILEYLKAYPDHASFFEAKTLLGDIAMGKGELEEAMANFRSVSTEEPTLFMYAYFQIGKILQALDKIEELEDHYREYVENLEFEGKARLSEAIYWIGWAMDQLGRGDETIPYYASAIQTYGDNPDSTELVGMLDALSKLTNRHGIDGLLSEDVESSELPYRNFPEWLGWQMDQAEKDEAFTYWSRIRYYEALQIRRRGEPELALSAIRGISIDVEKEDLDPLLLGEVGVALISNGLESGKEYLREVLVSYPKSPHRALAYYGLALSYFNSSEFDRAKKWISQFEKQFSNHPLSVDAKLLKGENYRKLGRLEFSVEAFNELLTWRHARGEPHVKALMGLAGANEDSGEITTAIPYYQRVYTLYRRYTEYVSVAYLRSAMLFERIGDLIAAGNTLKEMLEQADLSETESFQDALIVWDRIEDTYIEALEATKVTEESKAETLQEGQR